MLLAGVTIPCLASLVLAQSGAPTAPSADYIPRLGDIMSAIQARHVKLYYASKAGNWDLAAYEARQLKGGLIEAARLYAGIPVSNVTTMAQPMQSVDDAIAAKDLQGFSHAFAGLTEACNGCHAAMGRAFIVMRTPAEAQPLGDQSFSPRKKP